METNPSTAELLGRGYAAIVCAMGTLKADFRAGKFSEEHYEALEEEMARLCKDTLNLAQTMGWVRGR